MGYFNYDSKCSLDFGLNVSGTGSWATPQRKIETVEVPGRPGRLITYVGFWSHVDIVYPAWISRGFDKKWDAFAEWWNAHTDNLYKLTDSYHPKYYRMARALSPLEPEVRTLNRSGRFDLKFQAMPQKYLIDGDVPRILAEGEEIILSNPTSYDAYPVIIAKIRDSERHEIGVYDDLESVIGEIKFKVSDSAYDYLGNDIKYDAEIHEATCQFPGLLAGANGAIIESFPNEYKTLCIPAGKTVTVKSWHGEFEFYPRWYMI